MDEIAWLFNLAATKFMYWLRHTIGTCEMTEMTIARKIEELRSKQEGYLGPLTDEEKEIFTVVAMSMLKAGSMKFLYGCRGINLDYTIREALWQRGLDFSHGTGHSVGYVLNF